MPDLAFDTAVELALVEIDEARDAGTIVEAAIALGTGLVYATLAVAEAIAAASEDALTDVVDERVDLAFAETLEIAAELEHDPEADTGVIEVAS